MSIEYFKLFGLPVGSTEAEIKARYKVLAKTFHPDINKKPEAEEQFKKINTGYQWLIQYTKQVTPPQFKPVVRDFNYAIYRMLDKNRPDKSYIVIYQDDVLPSDTRLFFMYDTMEFSIKFDSDKTLPVTVKVLSPAGPLTITIRKGMV